MNQIIDSFISQIQNNVSRFAEKEAVKVGAVSLSFSEVNEKTIVISDRINEILDKSNKQDVPYVRIGVYMNKSEWLVPAIWAILKNGYTYVPIDPDTPHQRIDSIMQDSGMQMVLVNSQTKSLTTAIEAIDVSDGYVPQQKHDTVTTDSEIAYIIYTSGTTGVPKGIPISYQNVTTFLQSLSRPEIFGIDSDSVLMLFASINFDTSIAPILGSLYYGAKQVIALENERTDPKLLSSLMLREKVTYVCLPPTLLAQLATYDYPDMKTLVSAGEPLIQSAADKALGHSYRLVNAYGPTECTVFATFRDVSPDVPCRNIGVPMPHVITYIVDENFVPVGQGVIGELILGGPQLTQGYLHRPELNQQAFVANPFEDTQKEAPTLYHTGDLVKLTEEGTFDYLGRMDSQVKIRSYRVELGEVKYHIEQCPQVLQSVVRVEKIGTEDHIVAYVRLKDDNTDIALIKKTLGAMMPEYMIPDYFVKVDHFELNVNGKIDKSKLYNTAIAKFTTNTREKTAAETTITEIIADAFGTDDINVDTDLIDELGLTSIQLMQATVNFYNIGVHITAHDIYEQRTIKNLAVKSTSRQYYWLNEPVEGKPVMVIISGYTSFEYLYRKLADDIQNRYNIYIIESYHDNYSLTPRTTEAYIEDYLQQLEPIIRHYGIDIITGFCLGGEMGLYLAYKLEKLMDLMPHVVVLDGIPNRFKDANKNVPLYWKCLTPAMNNRRVAQDNCIIETMPDFHYDGQVTSILSDEFQKNNPTILETDIITEEQEEGEYYMFEHAEESWKSCYPDSTVIIHRVGHYDYLIDEEKSIRPLADFFNTVDLAK